METAAHQLAICAMDTTKWKPHPKRSHDLRQAVQQAQRALARAQKQADRARRNRQQCVDQKMESHSKEQLAAEGIEENPGPQASVASPDERTERRRGQDVPKRSKRCGPKQSASPVVKLLTEELEKLKAQQQAAEDVRLEAENEKQREEKIAKATQSFNRAREGEKIKGLVLPKGVAWHVGHESDPTIAFHEVRRIPADLTAYPVAHRVAYAQLLDVVALIEEQFDADGNRIGIKARESETPHHGDSVKPKGVFHWATYGVTITSLNMVGEAVHTESVELGFSLEQWIHARGRRLARVDIGSSLPRVRAFRSNVTNFGMMDYQRGNDSEVNDELFTALLLVDDVVVENGCKMWTEMALKATCRKIRSEIMKCEGEPVVEGTYIRGYDLEFQDVFPDIMKDALARMDLGESARDAADWAYTKMADITCGYRTLRGKASEWADSWEYARMVEALHIDHLYPAFPNPCSLKNAAIGMAKRIIRPIKPRDTYAVQAEAVVAQELAAKVVPEEEFDKGKAIEEAEHKAASEPWTEDQRRDYVAGAHEAVSLAEEWVTGKKKELEERITRFTMFIKQESYAPDAKKAVRYITAPMHYVRGFMATILEPGENAFIRSFSTHMVKGLKVAETRDKILDQFSGYTRIFESDFSSWESLIHSGRQLTNEMVVLVASSPPKVRGLVEHLLTHLATSDLTFKTAFGEGRLPNIRFSGTHHTSVGNAIQNVCAQFAAMARTAGLPAQRAGEYLRNFRNPFLVEGDDFVCALPPEVELPGLLAAHKAAGSEVKSDLKEVVENANFCGQTVVLTELGNEVDKDPIDCLSKIGICMGADKTTKAKDLELMVAKCMSYASTFPNLPILQAYIDAVIERFRDVRAGIILAYHDVNRKGMGRAGADYLHSLKRKGILFADGFKTEASRVSQGMRQRLAERYSALTAEVQVRIEEDLVAQIRRGATVLSSPILTDTWLACQGVAAMLEHKFEGRRAAAEQAVRRFQDRAAGAAVATRVLSYTTASAACNAVSGVMGLAAMLLAALAGWGWMALFVPFLMLIALAVGALVLVVGGSFVLEHVFGIPRAWAKRALQLAMWAVVAVFGIYWARMLLRWSADVNAPAAAPAAPIPPSAAVPVAGEEPTLKQRFNRLFRRPN